MTKTKDHSKLFIKDMDITVRAKNILTLLDVFTMSDLYMLYLLDTIPKIGTTVKHYPFVKIDMTYCRKVNEEVKELLREYCNVEEVELNDIGIK